MCIVKSLPVMSMLLTFQLEHRRNRSDLSNNKKNQILLSVHVCVTGVDSQKEEGEIKRNSWKRRSGELIMLGFFMLEWCAIY